MNDVTSGRGAGDAMPPRGRGRRFSHRQIEALIDHGDVSAAWDERDPVCAAIGEMLHAHAKRNTPGRVREEYLSLEECSAATRIPLETLERARDCGCPAFDGGRVRLLPYLQWACAGGSVPPIEFCRELEQHRILQGSLLRLELRELQGRYVRIRQAERLLSEIRESVQRVFALLREAAPGFRGHSEAEIAQRLSLEAEVLEAQAAIIDQALAFWRQPARRGMKRP